MLTRDISGDQPMGDTTDTPQIYRQICLWQKEPCYKELLRVIKAIVALLPWHSLIVLFLPLVMPEPAWPYLLLHCSCQHLPTWTQEPSMWGWKVTSSPWCHLNSNNQYTGMGMGQPWKYISPIFIVMLLQILSHMYQINVFVLLFLYLKKESL